MTMLVPIFSLKLNHKITPRTVAIGKYDGQNPTLTCATSAGKVLMHSPHAKLEGSESDINMLNINEQISTLATGILDPSHNRDLLVVGTPTTVLAYDVNSNKDLFYKDSPDGANAIVIGKLGEIEKPLAVVGGNCSIQGYNLDGEDNFWTVTGDNVQSLCLLDFIGNGENELIVGSEDFDIRVFREDEIISEMTETEVVTNLCTMRDNKFGYSLANGTVGIYDRNSRLWRIKSKNTAMSILGYDLDNDGVDELITGWSNGKIDARKENNGEVVFKTKCFGSVAGLVRADYRMDRSSDTGDQLICVSSDGEVRGYNPATGGQGASLVDGNVEQDTIRELSQKKQNMMLELKNYAENSKIASSGAGLALAAALNSGGGNQHGGPGSVPFPGMGGLQPGQSGGMDTTGGAGGDHFLGGKPGGLGGATSSNSGLSVGPSGLSQSSILSQGVENYKLGGGMGEYQRHAVGMIPANTQLQTTLTVNPGDSTSPPHVELSISTTNETIIRAALLFAEGIFEGECHVVHPNGSTLGNLLKIPIVPPKDVPVDLHIKSLIGHRASTQFHVFELTRLLPKFSMYSVVEGDVPLPKSSVTFTLNDRPQRVLMWINQSFLLNDDLTCSGDLDASFMSLRDGGPLVIRMTQTGQATILTDNMELAGEVIQEMASFLNLEDLATTADFPIETEALKQILFKVDEFHKTRNKLTAEMADHSNLIRSMVVRAEDSRIMGDMRSMRKGYMELFDLNRDLIAGYNIRCSNHQELVSCLKQVNQTIQKAGRLRVGKYKTQVVNACRAAIKSNNMSSLFRIIHSGAV